MDVSPEEALAIVTILRKRRKRSRRIWIREHYLLRPELGEFFRTYKNLLDNPDEELFFNYLRMSYDSFAELLALVRPHLTSKGSNWRTPISAEEKLVLTLG